MCPITLWNRAVKRSSEKCNQMQYTSCYVCTRFGGQLGQHFFIFFFLGSLTSKKRGEVKLLHWTCPCQCTNAQYMYLSSTIQRCRFSGPLLDSLINFVLTIIQSYSNVRSGEMNNAKIYALFGAVFVILEAEAFCLLDLCWHLAHTHVSIELPLLLCFVLDCFEFFHSFRLLS